MQCPEALRVQAYFDGEAEALAAADIERHMDHCTECRSLVRDLQRSRSLMGEKSRLVGTPPALRAKILAALDSASTQVARVPISPRAWRTRPYWYGAFTGVVGAAIAASLLIYMGGPILSGSGFIIRDEGQEGPPETGHVLADELVAAHVRSLMPTHLIDVVSTDKHTVKPWFAGHADVSPVVADFAAQGYLLSGGRADYFEHQRVAVVVYQHGPHIINVFSWAGRGWSTPRDETRNGYHLAYWSLGNLAYCAVSDTGWQELHQLGQLLRDADSGDLAAARALP